MQSFGPYDGPRVPWLTKPRASIYYELNEILNTPTCVGHPPVPDVPRSNFSSGTGSNANTSQYGSGSDGMTSYVPLPMGNMSWYPDSRATHHVCKDGSTLNGSTHCSSTTPILMGDGTCVPIKSIGCNTPYPY